jgi:hypothetical protein
MTTNNTLTRGSRNSVYRSQLTRQASEIFSSMENRGRYLRKWVKLSFLSLITGIVVWLSSYWGNMVIALPPPQDTPEEILRTEIIIDARSPIDGKPLNAAEYAQVQEQLKISPPPTIDSKLRQTLFLIRIRNALLQLFPFLNF